MKELVDSDDPRLLAVKSGAVLAFLKNLVCIDHLKDLDKWLSK